MKFLKKYKSLYKENNDKIRLYRGLEQKYNKNYDISKSDAQKETRQLVNMIKDELVKTNLFPNSIKSWDKYDSFIQYCLNNRSIIENFMSDDGKD